MSEIKKISETQLRNMLNLVKGGHLWDERCTDIWKSAGYIEQSELEKAKENYLRSIDCKNHYRDLKDRQIYINELEKEIERLNK